MKRFSHVFSAAALISTAVLVAAFAQNFPGQRSLKEYENPPSIKPVDTVFMEDMTWLEIKNAIKSGKTLAIVAAGGLEASGPFLTLNKHQNMLRGTTEVVARKLGNALVAPLVKFTPADENTRPDYLGDFFISSTAYKATLIDICSNLMNHGFKEIVLIGDHQGAQRGMREVSEELRTKWTGAPAKVHYIPEYYDRTAVNNYVKTTLGVTETNTGLGDNYYNTSILLATLPDAARLKQRTDAKQLTVNGVRLEPIQKTIQNGKKIIEMQADQTVKAIQKAVAEGKAN